MGEAIPLINLLSEIKELIRISQDSNAEFKCTVFEDNNGCIELAKCPWMRPRTKDISIKYHHLRKKVEERLIKVLKIDTKDQQAGVARSYILK
eukprot:11746344-Ditylum_brightwellii.AAC.1